MGFVRVEQQSFVRVSTSMPDTGAKEPANYQLKVGHLEKSENSKLYRPPTPPPSMPPAWNSSFLSLEDAKCDKT